MISKSLRVPTFSQHCFPLYSLTQHVQLQWGYARTDLDLSVLVDILYITIKKSVSGIHELGGWLSG